MSRDQASFLGLELEDEQDDASYGSGDAHDSKLKSFHQASKRRKISSPDDEASSDDSDIENSSKKLSRSSISPIRDARNPSDSGNPPASTPTSKLKPLTPKQLAKSQRAAQKTGVIYLSRIPPFMRPSTVRHLLSPYGTVARLFLTPEPTSAYTKRRGNGGNKKRSFVDGWVEFTSKREAKICAETLNGQTLGGKKGGWYRDDLWNMKYLKGFKWADLMEQVGREERVREGRMRVEIQKEARERKAFLVSMERSRKDQGMEKKRKKKLDALGEHTMTSLPDGGVDQAERIPLKGDSGIDNTIIEENRRGPMRFRQNVVHTGIATAADDSHEDGQVMGVLRKIF